ncbi:MAG TPA: phosphoribosylamine--glycine ligase [Candidatus Eremiobacteraceae bacterium]|nr:phosphoribosylamine--glycine ligase [Candidatus Eremiobacteraceae bacterium]
MKVLVVGSGAREHALAWKLKQSSEVTHIFAAPGNAGTALLGTNWPEVSATSGAALAQRAKAEAIGFAVIGPEGALAAGVSEALRGNGVTVFGPNRDGARLESSKSYAKQFMERNGIPTARHRVAHDRKQAEKHLAHWPARVVLKADGLAAGKGVVVCADTEEARRVLAEWYGKHALPGGGTEIVVEDALEGREVSVMAIFDGSSYALLSPACDYKRAGDGDSGANTGGMGAYSPAMDVLSDAQLKQVRTLVFDRALAGLQREGIDYRGCLYAGIMLTAGGPMVLEFNARFGDPETQVIVPRLESDLFAALFAAARGKLDENAIPRFIHNACVGVVLTSDGYPLHAQPVNNLPLFPSDRENVVAFWGASKLADGRVDASGGRVLTICGLGDTMDSARQAAYEGCSHYEQGLPAGVALRYRRDIASRAVAAVR